MTMMMMMIDHSLIIEHCWFWFWLPVLVPVLVLVLVLVLVPGAWCLVLGHDSLLVATRISRRSYIVPNYCCCQ